MKSSKIIMCLTACLFFLWACSDSGDTNKSNSGKKEVKQVAEKQPVDDLAVGKKLFKKWCVACHGMTGDMEVNGAKDLGKSVMTLEEKVEIISNGKGLMTPFKEMMLEEEIIQVAKYTDTFKK